MPDMFLYVMFSFEFIWFTHRNSAEKPLLSFLTFRNCFVFYFDPSQQTKLEEIHLRKKELDEKVEALRTVKETAEQPEKEAKERHLKAWEGKLRCESVAPSTVHREHHITETFTPSP